ncbi:HAD family hydrolase [Herbiconiux sp. YIM B11900]|uniref:HAD family hydrolase n=1 Tax=Herbiconiux sp. YIM B11900 TaxID=3404131 RepID=UPI003F84A02F
MRTDGALRGTMVLFDWNGSVVADADRARAALNAVLAQRSLPVLGEAEFSLRFRLPLSELFSRLGVATEDLAAAEQEWTEGMAHPHARLREGAMTCLTTLSAAGAWLGVLSAASAAAVRFDQRALSVPTVWNAIDASVTDKYAALMRHRPTRALAFYVADTADDLRCASAAGYIPVGLADEESGGADADALRAAGAAHVLLTLAELPRIVESETALVGSPAQVPV